VSSTGGRWGHLEHQGEHRSIDGQGVEGGGVLGGSGSSGLEVLGVVLSRDRYRLLRGVNRRYELLSGGGDGIEYGGHVVR
jgi:hypothetical protein